MIRKLRSNWRLVWHVLRYPIRRKSAWTNVIVWTVALIVAALSVTANLIVRDYTWLAWNLAVGAFDFLCLHRSIEGLLWLRAMERWIRVVGTSPGRGSTGE